MRLPFKPIDDEAPRQLVSPARCGSWKAAETATLAWPRRPVACSLAAAS